MFGVINGKLDYKIKNNEEAVIATAFFNSKSNYFMVNKYGIFKGNIKIELFVTVFKILVNT